MTSALTEIFPSITEGLRASTVLNNDVQMPWLGLGVYQIKGDPETAATVRTAIESGYRSIDTASLYGNERGVGQAVRECGVARNELFITTKVWNEDLRRDRVEAAFEDSLKKLNLDYIDLYLIHWPVKGKFVAAWKVLEKIYRTGRVKAIGVSNHMVPHLKELLAAAEIIPAVNQIEFHPYLRSPDLIAFCEEKKIRVEAWSPLMQGGDILENTTLQKIAQAHGKTVAQVILRWDVQRGVVTIPKSVKKNRILENAAIFDFRLADSEMGAIDALERGKRSGSDPFYFNF